MSVRGADATGLTLQPGVARGDDFGRIGADEKVCAFGNCDVRSVFSQSEVGAKSSGLLLNAAGIGEASVDLLKGTKNRDSDRQDGTQLGDDGPPRSDAAGRG
jgi:hypothetical protein